MDDGGSIILTASIASIKGFPGMSVYSATKAAVRSFARTWTNELGERRIRVNAISPGHIDTPIMESLQQGEALAEMKDGFRKAVPLGRMGDPDEIAKAVAVPRLRRGELCLRHRALRRRWCRPNLKWTFNVLAVLAEPRTSSHRPSQGRSRRCRSAGRENVTGVRGDVANLAVSAPFISLPSSTPIEIPTHL
jgi:hypothetical protein